VFEAMKSIAAKIRDMSGLTGDGAERFGTIRNPLAHNPKIEWEMSEHDALDILTMASLIHRRVDKAKRHDAACPRVS
jgi:hypothetical protein